MHISTFWAFVLAIFSVFVFGLEDGGPHEEPKDHGKHKPEDHSVPETENSPIPAPKGHPNPKPEGHPGGHPIPTPGGHPGPIPYPVPTSSESSTISTSETSSAPASSSTLPVPSYRNGLYYANYDTNYLPSELPVTDLTHIFYAFADVAADGTVTSGNPLVDTQFNFAARTSASKKLKSHKRKVRQADESTFPRMKRQNNVTDQNAFGAVQQLFYFKTQQRGLKVLLSIGGGSADDAFTGAASTDATRANFANTAVQLVTDWGFDGIDIDWEYPTTATDQANYVALLAAVRNAFDNYSLTNGLNYNFQISVAISASPEVYGVYDIAGMDPYVTLWNLLAYDYSGNYSLNATHQSNVYREEGITALDTDSAINYYLGQGILSTKLLLGLPLYGRSFENTNGLGQPFDGVGPGGPRPANESQEAGVWYYYQLPKAGATQLYDDIAQAAYSYDGTAREFITYDDIQSSTFKAQYLAARGLGGAFFFEARGDRAANDGSLVTTVRTVLPQAENSLNNLVYPTSQYDNIRNQTP